MALSLQTGFFIIEKFLKGLFKARIKKSLLRFIIYLLP